MAHYRSPLDYGEDKIEGLDESVERIFNSLGLIREECAAKRESHDDPEFRKESSDLIAMFWKCMDDDLNTPEAIAALFNLIRLANTQISQSKIDKDQLLRIKDAIETMLWVLGLEEERADLDSRKDAITGLALELRLASSGDAAATLDMLIDEREKARSSKDYAKSDLIRSKLKAIGIVLEDKRKDKESGPRWKVE
jgi:cysteinyl-tRNA synthetase